VFSKTVSSDVQVILIGAIVLIIVMVVVVVIVVMMDGNCNVLFGNTHAYFFLTC
jgi:flagellar biosynthesis/type III secretory pathway M-ring protein FliF/YscJ